MSTTKWGSISYSHHQHTISISLCTHICSRYIIATTASLSSVGIGLPYNPNSNPNFLKPHSSWPISNLLVPATASKHSWLSSSDKLGHPVSESQTTQSPLDDWSWQTAPSICGQAVRSVHVPQLKAEPEGTQSELTQVGVESTLNTNSHKGPWPVGQVTEGKSSPK